MGAGGTEARIVRLCLAAVAAAVAAGAAAPRYSRRILSGRMAAGVVVGSGDAAGEGGTAAEVCYPRCRGRKRGDDDDGDDGSGGDDGDDGAER